MSEESASVEYEDTPEAPKSWLMRQFEQVNTLLLAVLLALGIRAFVIEPFRIPSGSMLETLLIGDHLFVNKFIYGVKIPFTDRRLPALREPRRGDVIVFTVAREGPAIYPADRRPELPREEFVKRIVGLPGDEIQVLDGELRVNGEAVLVEERAATFTSPEGIELRVNIEDLDGCRYRVLDDPRGQGLQQQPFRVPDGRYFMMGDNRDHSNDSRNWGTVKLSQVKGPAFVLYWSWNYNGGWGALLNPITWWHLLTVETRWSRFGDSVGCLPD